MNSTVRKLLSVEEIPLKWKWSWIGRPTSDLHTKISAVNSNQQLLTELTTWTKWRNNGAHAAHTSTNLLPSVTSPW